MNYIDIILIAIVLLSVFVGYLRGFVGSIIKLFSGIVKLVISYFLCKPLSNLISNITKLDEKLIESFRTWVSGLSAKFNVNLVGLSQEQLNASVGDALADTKLPKFFRGVFTNIFSITPENINGYETITISDLIAKTLSVIALLVISFVAIYLLITIGLFIFKIIYKKSISGQPVLVRRDRRFGAIVGLVKSFVVICAIFLVLSLFKNSELFAPLFLKINDSFLGGPLSKWIFFTSEKYFNLKEVLVNWLQK